LFAKFAGIQPVPDAEMLPPALFNAAFPKIKLGQVAETPGPPLFTVELPV